MTDSDGTKVIARAAPVAIVMIALNEAHNLEDCLQRIDGWAEQIFLVDSYSRDATVDIALKHGVHVVQRTFRGFGDQWNFALNELPITAKWTMKLDPDERLTDELKQEISGAIARDEVDAYNVKIRLWFMGKRLPAKLSLTRLWRTGMSQFSGVSVNEHALVAGRVGTLHAEIEHHDSPNLEHWLDKQNRYTTAEALAAFHGGKLAATPKLFGSALERRMWLKKHYMRAPFRYALMFWYHYIVKGAWRAGWVGYAWSRLRSDVYRFTEYKLREMRLAGRESVSIPRGVGTPDARVRQY